MSHCSVRPRRNAVLNVLLISGSLFGSNLVESMVATASDGPPLHTRIDRFIEAAHAGPPTAPASDADFLRRVYLDLIGRVPTSMEAREFLSDVSPDKRAGLVANLLARPEATRHLSNVLDVMLMERRPDVHIKTTEWESYLFASLQADKPYDQLAREILSADGVDDAVRPSVKFYLDREGDPHLLTREIGRMFFGRDIQCSQCHDHPLIDGYLQPDYYGLYAFVSRGTVFTDKDKKVFYAEKAEGDASYQSVFNPDQKGNALPQIPGGEILVDQAFAKGQEYIVAPADNVRPVPKYSRRARLAELTTNGTNRDFNRNIVNRLWAHMMGRGLVHPVDLHHAANPPSHPELLEVLADEFVTLKFDIKAFLRELALSQTYQRAFEMPSDLTERVTSLEAELPTLKAERDQLQPELEVAEKEYQRLSNELRATRQTLAAAATAFAQAELELNTTQAESERVSATLTEARGQLTLKQSARDAIATAVGKTAEAAKQLADDPELTEVSTKLQAKVDLLTTEIAALTKTVDEQTPVLAELQQKLATLPPAVAEATTKRDDVQTQLDALRPQFVAAEKLFNERHFLHHRVSRKLDGARTLVDYAQASAQLSQSEQTIAQSQSLLTEKLQAQTELTTKLAALDAQLQALSKSRESAEATLKDTTPSFKTQQQVSALLAETVAKTNAAIAQLGGDTELTAVVAQLKTQSDKSAQASAASQKIIEAAQQQATTAAAEMATVEADRKTQADSLAKLQTEIPELQEQIAQASTEADSQRAAVNSAYTSLSTHWSNHFAVASLKPLTPEQMAWSSLQSLGFLEQHRLIAEAELDKAQQEKAAAEAEAKTSEAVGNVSTVDRNRQVESKVYEALKGNVQQFVNLFGAAPGQPQQDFFASVDQALFFANGGTLRSWITPNGVNLTSRLLKLEDPKVFADELYLSVLSRYPTAIEIREMTDHLTAQAGDRTAAVEEIVWALLTSAEFRFNH